MPLVDPRPGVGRWTTAALLPGMIEAVVSQPYEGSRLAGAYQRGNEMPARSLQSWVGLITSFASPGQSRIVDVGAGTGMFAAALAEGATSRCVLGVDPSRAMLSEARRHNTHPRVGYVVGDAGALPVAAQRFDLALLSRVIHHLPDRRGAPSNSSARCDPAGWWSCARRWLSTLTLWSTTTGHDYARSTAAVPYARRGHRGLPHGRLHHNRARLVRAARPFQPARAP